MVPNHSAQADEEGVELTNEFLRFQEGIHDRALVDGIKGNPRGDSGGADSIPPAYCMPEWYKSQPVLLCATFQPMQTGGGRIRQIICYSALVS